MSTRGAVGFVVDSQEKIAYNHSDSYPDSLGVAVFDFLKEADLETLPEIVRNIEMIDQDKAPTPEQVEHCRETGTVDLGVSKQSETDWYCLLRGAQGDLSFYTRGLRYMVDSRDFLADSLFCEWAYIINLGERVLEVYQGFNKNSNAPGRYAKLNNKNNKPDKKGERFYGVVLILAIPFEVVKEIDSTEFLKQVEAAVPEEKEQ